MLNWFNALVSAAVLLILIVSAGDALMGLESFDPVAISGSVFLLLMLPVLFKLAGRRPRDKRRK